VPVIAPLTRTFRHTAEAEIACLKVHSVIPSRNTRGPKFLCRDGRFCSRALEIRLKAATPVHCRSMRNRTRRSYPAVRFSSLRWARPRECDIIEKVHVGMLTIALRRSASTRGRCKTRSCGRHDLVPDQSAQRQGGRDRGRPQDRSLFCGCAGASVSLDHRARRARPRSGAADLERQRLDVAEEIEDPNLRVLRVEPQIAEVGTGRPARPRWLVKACSTGEEPNLGENQKATISWRPPRACTAAQADYIVAASDRNFCDIHLLYRG
jgi:hypothetical protein